MNRGALLLVCAALGACANKDESPAFHPLPQLAFTETAKNHDGQSVASYNDFVVISRPPTDRNALRTLVDAYNAKTVSTEQLGRQYGYIRRFFKESPSMRRNYHEAHNGYFNIDRWENHGDDIVIIVKWLNFGKERIYE
jgi:hypothetical protein